MLDEAVNPCHGHTFFIRLAKERKKKSQRKIGLKNAPRLNIFHKLFKHGYYIHAGTGSTKLLKGVIETVGQ